MQKNNCICCSRLYIDASIRPSNLEKLEKCFLDYVSNNLKIFLKENSYNKIKFNIFFDSIEQYSAINSDKKRCLNTYVVNNFFELITSFFETHIRVFCNFFHNIANYFYIKAEKNFFFLCNVLILF